MNLTDSEEETLERCGKEMRKILLPHAVEEAKISTKSQHQILVALAKPYLRRSDGRSKPWHVKAYIWNIPLNGELSEGSLLAENDLELVEGFRGIVRLVRSYIRDEHDTAPSNVPNSNPDGLPYPFTALALMQHLERMRGNFRKGVNMSTARWYYVISDKYYLFQADISRAEETS